jgi:phosphoesterase RecJ-like protein
VNIPLNAREVTAVALFKRQSPGLYRLSLRSKGEVDVRSVAARWQGGGHKNAAGATLSGGLDQLRAEVVRALGDATSGVHPPARPGA